MADKNNKADESVPGKYYVDKSCIFTSACCGSAPKNFKTSADGNFCIVYKQPENEQEEALCQEAMAGCPVGSIGNDGDEAQLANAENKKES